MGTKCLDRSSHKVNTIFMNRFLVGASELNLSPLPIFYSRLSMCYRGFTYQTEASFGVEVFDHDSLDFIFVSSPNYYPEAVPLPVRFLKELYFLDFVLYSIPSQIILHRQWFLFHNLFL